MDEFGTRYLPLSIYNLSVCYHFIIENSDYASLSTSSMAGTDVIMLASHTFTPSYTVAISVSVITNICQRFSEFNGRRRM